MNTRRYQLRLDGLRNGAGRVGATTLTRVVEALLKTAERATRLLATGKGAGLGKTPRWLRNAADFTLTGLKPGSTILDIEAPSLRGAACETFAVQSLLADRKETCQPSLDDTALDLAALAIQEAQEDHPAGDRFDGSVLEAILGFRKAAGGSGVRYEMTSRASAHGNFLLDDSACARIEERLNSIPSPRAFIVSGRLDRIEHDAAKFRLVVNRSSSLLGKLVGEAIDVEFLRSLWGAQTTVEGVVHFKHNGQPRLIEARRIRGCMDGDSVFKEMPSVEAPALRGLTADETRRGRSADFMKLWGAWPGDEPMEELLAQLG